jgi:hypothetical protein
MEKNDDIYALNNQPNEQLERPHTNENSANGARSDFNDQINLQDCKRSHCSDNTPNNVQAGLEQEEEYIEEEEFNPVCDLCRDSPDEIIQLNCVHKFCLFCSIEVIFHKITFKNKNEKQHMLDSIFTNIKCAVCHTNTELGEDCIVAIKTCFEENFNSCLIDNDDPLQEVENSSSYIRNNSIPEEIEEVDEDNYSDENVNLLL